VSSLAARVAALAFCALLAPAASARADDRTELAKALLAATVRAVDLEVEGYRARLRAAESGTGQQDNAERFRQRIAALEAERAKLGRMKPEEYPEPLRPQADGGSILEPDGGFGVVLPPVLREVTATIDQPAADGALLSVNGTSRSGPFYHLAGIKGGDYGVLKRAKQYRLTLCLVYRREYFGFIGDYYVFVADVK
jgi:hypothetical protein